jgi:hypothetical protein
VRSRYKNDHIAASKESFCQVCATKNIPRYVRVILLNNPLHSGPYLTLALVLQTIEGVA